MLAVLVLVTCTIASQVRAKGPGHANPNILWQLVHDGCAPAARNHQYPPKPCVEVSAPSGRFERGYAVLKDIRGRSQYLVLPLTRITGIGSPSVRQADAPNYFADAWAARLYVDAALHNALPGITGHWKPLPTPLLGHAYMAKWVGGASLAINPFRSLASALPAGADKDAYGLAVAGAYSPGGKSGFILLATRADISKGNYGSSEELQDHACAIARR